MDKAAKYSARKMLAYSADELSAMLKGFFTLVFDDGSMQVSANGTVFSSIVWDFHRKYPDTPMLMKHHSDYVIKDAKFENNTYIKLINNVVWSVFDAYRGKVGAPSLNELAKQVYEMSNLYYNDMVFRTEKEVVSLDILDFIQIISQPNIKQVLDQNGHDHEFIDNSYKTIKAELNHNPELANNNLVRAVQAGLVREGQTLQCLGPRGYVTDIDSNFFREPISVGFSHGLRKFQDLLVESRSSAKSLVSNKLLISEAEYFARRLQILTQIVQTLYHGDCGSQHYLRWKVRDKLLDNEGGLLRPSDLKILQGKYYLDEESNTLKTIGVGDAHLIGKIIKMRSPIAGCRIADPNGICSTCLGEMSLSIPEGTNLGHICSATMTEQSNQNILSTKHFLDGAALVRSITIPNEYKKFLKVSASGNGYMFNEEIAKNKNFIVVAPYMVPGLVDIRNVEDIHELALTHVSEFDGINLLTIDKDGKESNQLLMLAVDRRYASFSYPMLMHIAQVGWSFDSRGNYVISLEGWNYKKPAMRLPMRQYSMSDHAKAISIAIESSKERLKEKDGDMSPEDSLVELSDLVNSKLNVNIALIEVILLGSLVRDLEGENYFIPKEGTGKQMSAASATIAGRSMSATFAYKSMAARIIDPKSLFNDFRPQLPMDVFIKPQETLTDPYRYSRYYKVK